MKSVEERLAIVNKILFGGNFALMTDPIKRGSVHNKMIREKCTGFSMELDNLSYRGIWISTIEDIKLVLDGQSISKDDMLIRIKGMTIPIDALGEHTEVFWGPEDKCILEVNMVKGLLKGKHKIELCILKRADFGHSYGNGIEGYENAHEFLNPEIIRDALVVEV